MDAGVPRFQYVSADFDKIKGITSKTRGKSEAKVGIGPTGEKVKFRELELLNLHDYADAYEYTLVNDHRQRRWLEC
ncbi:MAG: hypothetical protein H6638_05540 [Ardenticatenales bacterium]|nr:hypothetical protein [Ardenticatenales bacterium]